MNLLLVDACEIAADGTCTLGEASSASRGEAPRAGGVGPCDRRAQHLREVLGVRVGQAVRAGVIGGGVGTARVLADDGVALTLALAITEPAPPPLGLELVLAVPRPKVIARVVETAAAYAVRRIDLTNAWRVDKSYLRSPRLAPDALAAAARLGAEQGATTHLPELAVHDRLMALLDARFAPPAPAAPAAPPAPRRLVAHPGAPPLERALEGTVFAASDPIVLAIGPEGGWIARELDTFVARGFIPVSLGAPILRVEAAVAAALGQLLLLDRLRAAADLQRS